MSTTAMPQGMLRRRTVDPSVVRIPAGLVLMVVGQLGFQAGEYAWLGAQRSGGYVGPAFLLGDLPSERSVKVAMIAGGIIWIVGLLLLLLGVHRLTSTVDVAARAVRGAPSVRGSAAPFAGGLLTVLAGQVVYQLSQTPTIVVWAFGGDAMSRDPGGSAWGWVGAVMSIVGLVALLLGMYRLVVNIKVTAEAAARTAEASA